MILKPGKTVFDWQLFKFGIIEYVKYNDPSRRMDYVDVRYEYDNGNKILTRTYALHNGERILTNHNGYKTAIILF